MTKDKASQLLPCDSQGGVKAVVHTDVLQTLLMFGGMLVVVVVNVVDVGGPAAVWDIAGRGRRLEFFK